MFHIGHGVEATWMQRMATQNSAYREPASAKNAELLDSLHGIYGAGGLETAMGTEQRAEEIAVAADEKNQETAHRFSNSCQCLSRLTRISSLLAAAAGDLACTTISSAGMVMHRLRKLSRTSRLRRLRDTAPGTALRATVMPSRAVLAWFRQAYTRKQESVLQNPLRKARLKQAGVRSRTSEGKPALDGIKGRVSLGPSRGGHSVPTARFSLPCAREIHVCASGAGYWAGRFFS